MEHRFVDAAQFVRWIQSGQIVDAATAAAYALLGLRRR